MTTKQPTIYDVAKQTKVSMATVSRVLNSYSAEKQQVLEEKNAFYRESLASLGAGDVLEGMAQLLVALRAREYETGLVKPNRPNSIGKTGHA